MSQEKELHRDELPRNQASTRFALWFGLIGGGVAWFLHLLSAYFIAEFGCVSGVGERVLGGITLVAWLVLGASAVTLSLALAATLVAYRGRQRFAVETLDDREEAGFEFELARTGFITSALFAFIIAVETVPIFFYLRHC